jgi:HlyD family secretion protein
MLDAPRLDVPPPEEVDSWTERSTRIWRSLANNPPVLKALQSARTLVWDWRFRGPSILAALAALWYFGMPFVLGPVVQAEVVIRADFVQTVVASGHVEAPFRVNVASQITGAVAEIPVSEGQSVKAGDTLIVLDDREARSAVVQGESAVAQAEARLRQLRELTLPTAEESLKQASATLVNAQRAYDRAAKLATDGYATRATLDDATKALDIARAQVRNAEFQVFTNRPGGSDFVMAETLRDQARAALLAAQSRLSYTIIKAPREGILISRTVERGNVVQPSTILMMLSPTGENQLVVQIDEKNLGLITIGQKALASADAFPKDSFPAVVTYINPGIDLQRASVEVKLGVPEAPAYLRQDMTVSVEIEVAKHAAALVVPADNLRGLNTRSPTVVKVASGRAKRQSVKVGIVSGGKAEILDGLKEGELVLPANTTLKEGARLRAETKTARSP